MPTDLQKARELFLHAVGKLPPEQWEGYVAEACGGDADLEQQVGCLLQVHREAGSFLDAPAPGLDATLNQPLLEKPGTQIGPYKLLQQIGEGGMGVVWMAEQTQPVQRKVALKVIRPGMDSRQVIARFEAERQALALMDHVNIARVLDAGTTESGLPYFVMELVHGVPITQYCDDNHLTPRERLELFVPVCQAIQHAHQKGIIHRDIKPSNVMVTLYDGKPVPKVIDFGVAKATEQKLTERTLFTQYGTMVGTLEYMSPEQAEMSALGVDTRSDIFSLGVLLYELLTGTTPLTHKRLKEAAYAEVLRLIKEEEPPRPSTRLSESGEALASISAQRHMEPAKLTKLVRGELDWIVMKTLDKDRNRRYETANALSAEVQNYLNDETVLACPPSAGYRFCKFARRNKAPLAFTGLVLLILLTVTGGIGWNVRDRAARQTAVEQEVKLALKEAEEWQEQGKWPEALSAAKRAEGLLAGGGSDELRERVHQLRKDLDMVVRLDDIRLLSSEWKDDKFDFESADQAYAQAFADYGIDVAGLPADEAATRIRERARVAIALATALDDWAFSRSRKDKAGSLALMAVAQSADPDPWRRQVREAHKQNDDKALAALAASPELLRQPPTTLVFLARAIGVLGNVEGEIELLRPAQRQYPGDFWINLHLALALGRLAPPYRDEAVSFDRAALAARPQSIAAHNNLGFDLSRQGKLDEAIDTYRRAIELDPKFTLARINLGEAVQKQGKVDEAIDWHRKTVNLDPKSAIAHIALGNALVDRKKMDEAIGEDHKAIQLDPKNALARYNLGRALADQQKLPEAIDAYLKAIEIKPKYADAYGALGLALAGQQKLPEAIDAYRKAIEINPKHAIAHNNLGAALIEQKKLDEGIAEYREAIKLDPKYAVAHYNLGCELSGKGLLDEAISEYREAIRLNPDWAEVHYDLGGNLLGKGLLDEAIAEYRTAIGLNKNDAKAHGALGYALYHKGQMDEAIAECREALRLKQDWPEVHLNLGSALSRKGQLDGAIAEYREALRLEKDNPKAHCGLGLSLMAKGRLDDAIGEYKEALRLKPDDAEAHQYLGNAQMAKAWDLANHSNPKLRDPIRAVELAKEAVEFAPQSAGAWQSLGWIQYRAGNWKACIEALEKSCKLQNPGDCGQWIVMSLAHGKLANEKDLPEQERDRHTSEAHRWYDEAVKQINTWGPVGDSVNQATRAFRAEAAELLGVNQAMKSLKMLAAAHPNVWEHRVALGKAYTEQGQWDEAAAEYTKAIELKPDAWEGWSGRAFIHFNRKQWDSAIADFSKAIDLAPEVHTNWWHRGHAYLQLAQWDKGAADFGKVVDRWPDGSEGWYLRAVALAQLKQPDKALADLRQAIAKGFNNLEWLKNDSRLAPLHTREDFGKLLEELERKGK
jgi:eukaryotic-like serine/threonine-protein kinase